MGLYYEVLQVLTYTDASDIGIGDYGGTIVRVSGAVGRDGTTHICREEHEAETRFKSQATLSITQSQNLMEKEPSTG